MGGSGAADWLGVLGASFEAGVARDEEVAAADLAFSLRQDLTLRDALTRAAAGWTLAAGDGGWSDVDEIGRDYVRAGAAVVPLARAVLRENDGARARPADLSFLEVLGAWGRRGAVVTVHARGVTASGQVTRVGPDHVAVTGRERQTLVPVGAIELVRVEAGYSASRGFSGSS